MDINSQVDGSFEGWQGESVYRLINGHVYQQSIYRYQYQYKYRPIALVYHENGQLIMDVEGSKAVVQRIS